MQVNFGKYTQTMRTQQYKSLLDHCRYYKGENQSPYKNPRQSYIWRFEKEWVDDTLTAYKSNDVTDRSYYNIAKYFDDGMTEFEQLDGVPLTLKSYLYAFHLKGNELPLREEFEHFYYLWRDRKV